MERFVHTLKGKTKEKIKRKSSQSSATMKEHGTTIREYVHLIVNWKLCFQAIIKASQKALEKENSDSIFFVDENGWTALQ